MASAGKGQNKREFLLELFQKNPKIGYNDALAAWSSAGNEGSFSESSFYNTKTEYNKSAGGASEYRAEKPKPARVGTGRPKGRPRKIVVPAVESKPAVAEAKPRKSAAGQVLDQVEDGIDGLIYKLKEAGGVPDVEAALRAARRKLAHIHGE